MNIGIFTGRLTADATFKNGSEPSKNNARFTIAITDPYNSEKTDFFTVSCFGKKADYVANGQQKGRFLKGCEVEVSGTVHFENYKTQNGEDRYYVNVLAESIYCKVHKDFKAAQNGNPSNMPQNNGTAGGYNQNGNVPQQQYNGQNAQPAGGNQYGRNPGYNNPGNTPSQQFNRTNAQPGNAGQYNGAPGYNNQGGNRPSQQYSGQNSQPAGGSQYGGNPGYHSQNGNSPQYNNQNARPDNASQYRDTSGFNQPSASSQYHPGNAPHPSDQQQYNAPGNIPDTIPAPEYKNEQEGGFRPATYQY